MKAMIFQVLIQIVSRLGTVCAANMHSENCMSVEGKAEDGREVRLTLVVGEDIKNA